MNIIEFFNFLKFVKVENERKGCTDKMCYLKEEEFKKNLIKLSTQQRI